MKNFRGILRQAHKAEDGLTLIELMVSIVIIVTVLLASAFALNAAFKAQTVSEVKSRAVEIAREQSEKAKQKSFVDTRILVPADGYRSGEVEVPATYKSEPVITRKAARVNDNGDLENVGFVYRTTQEKNGTKFTILTYVTKVTASSYDAAGSNVQMDPYVQNSTTTWTAPVVKRITVEVLWSIDGENHSTITNVIRTPRPDECIPPRVEKDGSATPSMWDAQERIQACESRRP